LAVMAGELDVEAMLRRHTAKWFLNWQAYYELEPFGEMRADLRAALICKTLADLKRGKNQKPYDIENFLFDFAGERTKKKGQSVQEKLAVMTVIARAWNAAQTEGTANIAAAQNVARAHGVSL
jgi:hypothetical protein